MNEPCTNINLHTKNLNFPQQNNFITLCSIIRLAMSWNVKTDFWLHLGDMERKFRSICPTIYTIFKTFSLYFQFLYGLLIAKDSFTGILVLFISLLLSHSLSLLPLFLLWSHFSLVVFLHSLALFLSTSPSILSFSCNAVLKDKNLFCFFNCIFNNTLSP